MKPIRENVFLVTYSELGKPGKRGFYKLPQGAGELLIDDADVHYIEEYLGRGWEPSFFVSRSPALTNNGYVVVSRQRA